MLLQIRKFAQRSYITIPLCAIMLFFTTACSTNEVTTEQPETISGKELFKSIFFATGEYALKLSSQSSQYEMFQSLSEEAQIDIATKINQLVEVIERNSPDFFADFQEAMYTSNHHIIKTAMEEGSKLVFEGLKEVMPEISAVNEQITADIESGLITTDGVIDEGKIELRKAEYERLLNNNIISGGREEACSLAIVCVVYFAVAAHNTVAVTALAAVAIAGALWLAVTVPEEMIDARSIDPLEYEIMINEIANSL